MEEGVRTLVDHYLPAEARALNFDTVEAAATPVGEIITRLDTLPFFGDRRVVLVKGLDEMAALAQQAMEEYLSHGLPPAVAIFTAESLDRRSRLFRAFQKQGQIHPCVPPRGREASEWARRYASRLRKKMGPPAAQDLVSLVGTGLRTLALEVDKLAAYSGDRPEITPEDVNAIASRLTETTVFALTDAVGGRDAGAALQALEGILQEEHPLVVLAMIATHYRKLARTLVSGARTAEELVQVIGGHPYPAQKLLGQAGHYRAEDIPRIFAALEETDRAIKSTGQPELALETMVVRLCAVPGEARRRSPGVGG